MRSLDISDEERKLILDHPERARQLSPVVYAQVLSGYRKGFRLVFIILACLAAFAFVTAFFLMQQRTLDRPDDKKLKEEGKEFIAQLKGKKEAAPKGELPDAPEKRAKEHSESSNV
ncbi:hypothetical protein DXG03_004158 [Asterophora parasitica]|uniref:Uncharacterized protein n=1 Tax=Asterophora parasitica TaxID=117018 RepID=A0A9P7K812_9AGAR|nr:hypothetical protein DXG03_004158 [Asterophora parasitica]